MLRRLVAMPPLITRGRTLATTARRNADLLQDLYLRELRAYKPAPAAKSDLPERVVAPAAPPKPEVQTAPTAPLEPLAAAEKAEWPAIRADPFDDPSLYDTDYEYSCDSGNHLLKRNTPRDYEHHH